MADIAAAFRSWSTTASSNSPSGSTVIGSGLDDNLRQIQATVKQYLASQGSAISSATTTDLSTATGFYVQISGTTTITAFGSENAGTHYLLEFAGALTLTHNATSLILPGAANITTAAGDLAWMVSEGSGNWRCALYTKATGKAPAQITLATEQASTSGTSIDFTGIPSGTKRITVMFKGVSTNGTADILFQLGSGSADATGYLGAGSILSGGAASTNYTTGFGLVMGSAALVLHGSVTFNLERASTFSWTASGVLASSDGARTFTTAGSKSLSAELDRIRVTTSNGTDAFDAGAISISYE